MLVEVFHMVEGIDQRNPELLPADLHVQYDFKIYKQSSSISN
jgi:hypothetical protein